MPRSDGSWVFEGFSNPNFTSVPDDFFDELAPRLRESELKVLLYIIRRTFGFKKDQDSISLSQMVDGIVRKDGTRLDSGTGLKKSAVCTALSSLEEKQIIFRKKQFDSVRGAVASAYRLNIHGYEPAAKKKVSTPVHVGGQGGTDPSPRGRTGVGRGDGQGLSAYTDTQDTVSNIQLYNNVNVSNKKERSPLYKLDDEQEDTDHIKLIATDILEVLGDEHSMRFYLLVARKIPEQKVRAILSELKQSTVRSKARLFTHKVMEFVESAINYKLEQEYEAHKMKELKKGRDHLAKRYKKH